MRLQDKTRIPRKFFIKFVPTYFFTITKRFNDIHKHEKIYNITTYHRDGNHLLCIALFPDYVS